MASVTAAWVRRALCWLLAAAAAAGAPAAGQGNAEPEAPDPAAAEPPAAAALTAGVEAGGAATRYQFRLVPRLDSGRRLHPNAGFTLPPLRPRFSPLTLDYRRLERPPGPQVALGVSVDLAAVDAPDQAKAQEFGDLDDGVAIGFDGQLRSKAFSLRATGRHLGLEDFDFHLDLRRYDSFQLEARYSQIPHRYAFGARSLYRGVGSGTLLIDDDAQAALQDTNSALEGARLLTALVDGAAHVDLGHRRDRTGIVFDWTRFHPLSIEVRVADESRLGTRPWSGSFGFGNVVEIPWPVDYDTRDVRIAAEWLHDGLLLRGAYRRADFDSNIDTLLFDNPWRLTDSSQPGAAISTSAGGPATGLIDLYPSNRQEEWTLTAARHGLPLGTTAHAVVSWGRLRQDDRLLPYTVNSAVVPGAAGDPPFDASDPANRPAERAGARLDTRLIQARVSAKPLPRLRLAAHLRDYRQDNDSARIVIPGFVREDAVWRTAPTASGLTNLPLARATTRWGVDAGIELAPRTTLTLSYADERVERDFREVARTDEKVFKVAIDAKPAAWVDLRASYQVAERDAGPYRFDQFFVNQGLDDIPVLPFLRKLDQADRERDRLQVLATFYPLEPLAVTASAIAGRDDFPSSRFGVLGDDHEIYTLDASYAFGERLSLFVSYSVERYDLRLQGREWFPGSVSDPYGAQPGLESDSNWTARALDDVDTAAFGLEAVLVPERLRLEIAWVRSRSDGTQRMASPVGSEATDLSPFPLADFTAVDDVTWSNIRPQLAYRLGERLELRLAYVRERYAIDDFNLDGFALVPVTVDGEFNGALFQGTLFDDYDFAAWVLRLRYQR